MRQTITTDCSESYDQPSFVGWYDTDSAIRINTNRNHNSSRWSSASITRTGKLVINHITQWQGEEDKCHLISLKGAISITDVDDFAAELDDSIATDKAKNNKVLMKSLLELKSQLEQFLSKTEL